MTAHRYICPHCPYTTVQVAPQVWHRCPRQATKRDQWVSLTRTEQEVGT